jgi:hypothetical protein
LAHRIPNCLNILNIQLKLNPACLATRRHDH